jgi:hypothetical protein
MSLRYVKHFDLNILKLADNLILHDNLFQRMAELCANDFFIIFVLGRITAKLLLDTINSRLFSLSKIQKYLDKKSRILFFNSYILPNFDYCSNVWGNLNDAPFIYGIQIFI